MKDKMKNLSMRISPKYKVSHWKKLDFSKEKDWHKAIDIFKDRISGRFLRYINYIARSNFTGFMVLALDCLLIETFQQFREGVKRTPQGKSGQFFECFLTETSFGKYFTKETAAIFYKQIRCGILHQGEIEGSSRVIITKNTPLVKCTGDKKGLMINRKLFHRQLMIEFESYVKKLKNQSNEELRWNFKKKMDYICRIPEVE